MILLRTTPHIEAAGLVQRIGQVAQQHPGDHALRVDVVDGGRVTRSLTLGPGWRLDGSAAGLAALSEFGEAEVRP